MLLLLIFSYISNDLYSGPSLTNYSIILKYIENYFEIYGELTPEINFTLSNLMDRNQDENYKIINITYNETLIWENILFKNITFRFDEVDYFYDENDGLTLISYSTVFDNKIYCLLNIARTIYVAIILGWMIVKLDEDSKTHALYPLENIMNIIQKISRDPIGSRNTQKLYRKSTKSILEYADNSLNIDKIKDDEMNIYNNDNNQNAKQDLELNSNNKSIYIDDSENIRNKKLNKKERNKLKSKSNYEVKTIEAAVIKISALLAIGFGEAGEAIIKHNLKPRTQEVNPMVKGRKKIAIFGFCDIRHFPIVNECLQERTMSFVNQIANIVHTSVDLFTGAVNKNIGDAFLCVWKFRNNNKKKKTINQSEEYRNDKTPNDTKNNFISNKRKNKITHLINSKIYKENFSNTILNNIFESKNSITEIEFEDKRNKSIYNIEPNKIPEENQNNTLKKQSFSTKSKIKNVNEDNLNNLNNNPPNNSINYNININVLNIPENIPNINNNNKIKININNNNWINNHNSKNSFNFINNISSNNSNVDLLSNIKKNKSTNNVLNYSNENNNDKSYNTACIKNSFLNNNIRNNLNNNIDNFNKNSKLNDHKSKSLLYNENYLKNNLDEKTKNIKNFSILKKNMKIPCANVNEVIYQSEAADRALIGYLHIIKCINTKQNILLYRKDIDILNRIPNYKVKMGFGLHIGWAIEGAIGSHHKIDASYLSPNVNMSARLEAATKQYGVSILLSGNMYDSLSEELRDICRLIDNVTVKGSNKPIKLYTVDLNLDLTPSGKNQPNINLSENRKIYEDKKERINNTIKEYGSIVRYIFSKSSFKEMLTIKRPSSFKKVFKHAIDNYIQGDWTKSKKYLNKALKLDFNDGPSKTIYDYLSKFEFKAPPIWQGYRELNSK